MAGKLKAADLKAQLGFQVSSEDPEELFTLQDKVDIVVGRIDDGDDADADDGDGDASRL